MRFKSLRACWRMHGDAPNLLHVFTAYQDLARFHGGRGSGVHGEALDLDVDICAAGASVAAHNVTRALDSPVPGIELPIAVNTCLYSASTF